MSQCKAATNSQFHLKRAKTTLRIQRTRGEARRGRTPNRINTYISSTEPTYDSGISNPLNQSLSSLSNHILHAIHAENTSDGCQQRVSDGRLHSARIATHANPFLADKQIPGCRMRVIHPPFQHIPNGPYNKMPGVALHDHAGAHRSGRNQSAVGEDVVPGGELERRVGPLEPDSRENRGRRGVAVRPREDGLRAGRGGDALRAEQFAHGCQPRGGGDQRIAGEALRDGVENLLHQPVPARDLALEDALAGQQKHEARLEHDGLLGVELGGEGGGDSDLLGRGEESQRMEGVVAAGEVLGRGEERRDLGGFGKEGVQRGFVGGGGG